MESDARFFQRRALAELAAAKRAVTPAAKDRRMVLAEVFFERLKAAQDLQATQRTVSRAIFFHGDDSDRQR